MYLNELPEERCKQLIELNVAVTTMMTRVVLPGMVCYSSIQFMV